MKSLTEPSIFWNSFFTVSLHGERGAVTDRVILDTVFVLLVFLHLPPLCVLSTPVLIVCSALISSTSVSLTSPSFCILPSSFVSLSSYLLGSLRSFFRLACFTGPWFFALLSFSILFAFSDWFLLCPLPTPSDLLQTIVFLYLIRTELNLLYRLCLDLCPPHVSLWQKYDKPPSVSLFTFDGIWSLWLTHFLFSFNLNSCNYMK